MATGTLTCTECGAETDATRGEAWHVEGGTKVHTIQPGEQLCYDCVAKRPPGPSLAELARRRELEAEREHWLLAIVENVDRYGADGRGLDGDVVWVGDDPVELLDEYEANHMDTGSLYDVPANTFEGQRIRLDGCRERPLSSFVTG